MPSPTPRRFPLKKDILLRDSPRFILLFFLIAIVQSATPRTPGYFQQSVRYHIDVKLIPELTRLEGRQTMTYFNHSPDTLTELYFHLYWNKYRSHSYAFPFSNVERGYLEIVSLTDSAGNSLPYQIDNTVMRVELGKRAILPGDSLVLLIKFSALIPPAVDRFGFSGDHYDIGNWYPVPAVYDRYGWHASQHIDGEFYQEWGDYEVRITVPKDFVVAATGELLNPEVVPDSVEYPHRKIPYFDYSVLDTTTVTYHFRAKKVHDFAWSADPGFVLVQRKVGDVTVNYYLQNYRMEDWKESIEAGGEALKFFQEKIGPYPYSQLSVVAGFITAGGIEYPNIVFINDLISNPRSLAITVIHEIGHQWFYGLLANNQTRYGWMDEGFTSFYEIWCTEHIWGATGNVLSGKKNFWQRLFGYEMNARREAALNYLEYAFQGGEEPINTQFDFFQHNPYIPYYDKMAVVLFSLKNILGDSLFTHAVRTFYREWVFAHPYPEDLFVSFERATGMELDWFWDEWLGSTYLLDYTIKSVRGQWVTDVEGKKYRAYIHLRKKQHLAMPVKLNLRLRNGDRLSYRIPVEGWLRGGSQPDDLPGWSIASNDYLAQLTLPDKIKRVTIDHDYLFLDINPFNDDNRRLPRVHWYWMKRQYLSPHLDGYTASIFPYLFFNSIDGVKLGFRTTGNYIFPFYQHTADFMVGTRNGQPSGAFHWKSPLSLHLPGVFYAIGAFHQEGRAGGHLYLNLEGYHNDIKLGWRGIRLVNDDYLMKPWSPGQMSYVFLSWNFQRRFGYSQNRQTLNLLLKSSTFGSDYDYQKIELNGQWQFNFFTNQYLLFTVHSGALFGNPPVQELFYLAEASPLEQFTHLYARSKGSIPEAWVRQGHFFVPGGGNIRGALQTPPQADATGKYLLGGGLRISFTNPLSVLPFDIPVLTFLDWSLFTNWAEVWDKRFQADRFAGEAGVSISYGQFPIWMRYFSLSRIGIDFPIWLYNPQPGYREWDFRWTLRLELEDFIP